MWNLKKYNESVNTTKKKQWGEGRGEEKYRGRGVRGTNY